MKQSSLLFVLLCLFMGTAKAATISGVVSSVATCAPVSGQLVVVRDSNYMWQDSAVTNSSGFYSITVPSTVYPGGSGNIFIRMYACGIIVSSGATYTAGTNVTANLFVCGSAVSISGRVILGDSTTIATGPAKVWLIRRDVAPVTFDTSLVAVDSMITTGNYGYFTFWAACVPSTNKYLLKAALLPANTKYASYIPSYMDSSLQWNGGVIVPGSAFSAFAGTSYKIYLKAGTNPGGLGFIGGSVLLGANKGAAVGDPLASRMLILTTSTGKGIGYTYSDAAGKFQFAGVPVGTYKIFGDAGGKLNPALTVTITNTKATVNNIIFEENSKKFEGRFQAAGVSGLNALDGISVYPNPATDFIRVAGLSAIGGSKTLTLSSVTGAQISRQTTTTDAAVSTSTLPAGVYMLQVQTESGSASYRIIK